MKGSYRAPHFEPRFRACQLVTSAALWLFGCGSADHVLVPSQQEPDASRADVSSAVNVCPVFGGSLVMPQRIRPNESSSITVRVTDPDAPSAQLVFQWSAPSGSFSASDESVTTYRCGELGSIVLTMTARDRVGCVSQQRIDVECVAN